MWVIYLYLIINNIFMWKLWRPFKKVNKNLKEYIVWHKEGYEKGIDEMADELRPIMLKLNKKVDSKDTTIKYLRDLLSTKEDKSMCKILYISGSFLSAVAWAIIFYIVNQYI